MAGMSDALIARLKERASDPERRNDVPPTARGRTVEVGKFAVAGIDLGALLSRGTSRPQEPARCAPASPEAIADAERRLGFALPADLRRLYLEVADGGAGPGPGLLPLARLAETYSALVGTPPGPRGQKWPINLLPITRTNPGHDCIDTASGKIVFWDEETLADGVSDKVWKRSFKAEAPDLATRLESWLGTPSPEEKMKALMQETMRNTLREQLAYWRAKTPAERAAYGLPETGWEEVLFGHLGIDPSKL